MIIEQIMNVAAICAILNGMETEMRQAVGRSIMEGFTPNGEAVAKVENILADLKRLIKRIEELDISRTMFDEQIDRIADTALLIVL